MTPYNYYLYKYILLPILSPHDHRQEPYQEYHHSEGIQCMGQFTQHVVNVTTDIIVIPDHLKHS